MSDVPSWVLAISTIATATVALVPTLVEPRKDRLVREAGATAAERALRLAKLEALFLEMEKVSSYLDNLLIAEGARIFGPDDDGLLNPTVFSSPLIAYSIIATHFVDAIPIMDESRAHVTEAIVHFRDRVAAAQDGNARKAIRADTTFAVVNIHSQFLGKLRLHLYAKAAAYSS